MVMFGSIIAMALIVTGALQIPSAVAALPAGCTGNPHDQGETGNPHDPAGFHYHEADAYPGS
jgi:hypothetical protein